MQELKKELVEKYSVSIPRYTSYPTAPEWKEDFSYNDFLKANEFANENKSPVSLYFHLPFCESHCYFCACNVVISKKKEITKPYLENIKKEIKLKSKLIDKKRQVEQIHFGGGTPTFFAPEEIEELFTLIEEEFTIGENCEISIEIDPRVTTYEHMEMLSNLGFNRISLGIQDFNEKVQESINRIQSFSDTREIFDYARSFGFMSINVDLIYGLPNQTQETFSQTLEKILTLSPDRIALFHYAHLPKLLSHQEKYINDDLLPNSDEKIHIFQNAIRTFIDNEYIFIGLDHFAKAGDELTIAKKNKTLHRNFQGYTTKANCDLYGFGITAISNICNTFSQNIKKINPYYEKLNSDDHPLYKGLTLNNDDILRKNIIMRILCHGEVNKREIEDENNISFDKYFLSELERLKEFEKDNLIIFDKDKIHVTTLGQYFLRNIASVFDYYLNSNNGNQKIFSKVV